MGSMSPGEGSNADSEQLLGVWRCKCTTRRVVCSEQALVPSKPLGWRDALYLHRTSPNAAIVLIYA
jgi:hypothetical protein